MFVQTVSKVITITALDNVTKRFYKFEVFVSYCESVFTGDPHR